MKKATATTNEFFQIRLGTVFRSILLEYGLLNNKHIPRELLRESKDVRMALLEGLIDGDGHCKNDGRCYSITAKMENFIDGVIDLARSLEPVMSLIRNGELLLVLL